MFESQDSEYPSRPLSSEEHLDDLIISSALFAGPRDRKVAAHHSLLEYGYACSLAHMGEKGVAALVRHCRRSRSSLTASLSALFYTQMVEIKLANLALNELEPPIDKREEYLGFASIALQLEEPDGSVINLRPRASIQHQYFLDFLGIDETGG